jgi:hypothetical protein
MPVKKTVARCICCEDSSPYLRYYPICLVLEHVCDPQDTVRRMHVVLKNGGLLSSPSPTTARYYQESKVKGICS